MNQISVGLFTDGYIPIMDGVTLTVKNYAHWLDRILGPVSVITPYMPFYTDHEHFQVIRYLSMPTIVRPPYRFGLAGMDPKLQSALRKKDFAIVHAHSPFSAGTVAAKTARKKGVPLIATFHSKYRDDLTRAIGIKAIVDDQIKRMVDYYYSVDYVWVPQKGVAATLREYGYEGPYEVMENGIDLKAPACIEPLRARGAEDLALPEGLLVGLYVGQHILEKNLEFLMQSLPRIMEKVSEFRMVFVGQGYAKHRLQELAASLGISDKVLFRDVVYDRESLSAIYARADVFLFPSIYDNAPLVVREAAAFRTPALLIAGSTAADIIVDGQNGFLAENQLEAYSERVIGILGNQRSLEAAGLGAQRSLCRSWENVVSQVRNRYLEILSSWS